MNAIHAPRKRAVILTGFAFCCLAFCISIQQGSAAAEQTPSQQNQGEDSSQNYSSILQETETALKKAQKILIEYQRQCSDEAIDIYTSTINLLKPQIDKLKSLENRIDSQKTEVEDKLQASAKKMDEFKKYIQQPTGKDKEWPGYELDVLQWRDLRYQLMGIYRLNTNTKSLLKMSQKLLEQFGGLSSVCISILEYSSVDMASESEYDETAQVLQALSGLRDTTKKATEVAQEAIKSLKSDDLKNNDQVKDRFTTIISGIQNELNRLQPGSELDNAIYNLIWLAEYKIDELAKLGEPYDEIVKGWEELRSELNTIHFQIKENRELLYDQQTEIVRKEQQIIKLIKLQKAQKAVSEMKHLVAALNNVRQKLAKWTEDAQAQWTITHSDARNAPQ